MMRVRLGKMQTNNFPTTDYAVYAEPLKERSVVDARMVLEKFDLQRRLMSEISIDLNERMDIILKLGKIAIIWPKYEQLMQRDLDNEFKSNILNCFLMPGGMGISLTGIYIIGTRADSIGHIVSLFGVSLILASLLKRTLVSDLNEAQVTNRMQKYILEESKINED